MFGGVALVPAAALVKASRTSKTESKTHFQTRSDEV
jgi:hypothetical protein